MQMAGAALGVLLLASTAAAEEAQPSRPPEAGIDMLAGHWQKAVADYQRKLGLAVTGSLDERTVYALKNPARVSACADAAMPMADCLDEASRLDVLLDRLPARTEPADADAAAGTTTAPTVATDPCDDPKLPVDRCLQAISQMEHFLKSRSETKP